jgi:V8-like Glu-specific endopeptidase
MRLLSLLALCLLPAYADEGMWPFNQFPRDVVAQKHKLDVNADFLDRLRLASVRLTGAASGSFVSSTGSFVSSNGLVLTNQHVVASCLSEHNALANGYYAAAQANETKCPGFEAQVLMSVTDVTSNVTGPASEKTSASLKTASASAIQQRNAAIARIEQDCAAKSGNQCSVVKLFSGGRYDLYQYRIYSDLRLVFAPEYELAFFGRERDSITYLRYGLDIAFLRVYEGGKPAATPHFLAWSAQPVNEDDLVLAVGNPAATSRLATSAQLAFYRDTALPLTIRRLQTRIAQVNAAPESPEKQALLTSFLASYKLAAGKLIGLRDDRLVTRKTVFESKIKRAVQASKAGADGAKVWDEVATAYKNWTIYERPYQILEGSPAPGSVLFRMARNIVRHEEAGEGQINEQLEILLLTQYLEELQAVGQKEIPIKAIFENRTPQQAAEAYVKSSRLKDPTARHPADVKNSDDGMIHLALLLEEPSRKLAKRHEESIETLDTSAAEKIVQYRFKLFGAADYPDATGTPRIEFGVVKGYTDRAGISMPYASTFGGLYYRKDNQGPYMVPQRWVDLKPKLNLAAPLDFVSTCDIGGGDSGSPTVNREGKLVGVTFDGNLESLPDIFLYSDEQARAVHVSVIGIAESLEKVYRATALLQELGIVGP